MELLEYALKHFKELPAHRWQGQASSGEPIEVLEHRAGMDIGRGPWAKFRFREGDQEHSVQGYIGWNKKERIKFDNREVEGDDVDMTGAFQAVPPCLNVIIKYRFRDDTGAERDYRFEGQSAQIDI